MHRVLTIAGSDSCCGAGVQADLKTITALGAYGMCAVTAVTVQNTLGVESIFAVPPEYVGKQIDAVVNDIGVDALKTGMLVNAKVAEVVSDKVVSHKLKKLVVDPIIKSHEGKRLLSKRGVEKLYTTLVPLSYLITPNIPEAEILSNSKINNISEMRDAAKKIYELGVANVLIKGGHVPDQMEFGGIISNDEVVDVLYDGVSFEYFKEKKLYASNVHGTGCIYSAAITAELAKGTELIRSIKIAKKFITKILKAPLSLGKGVKLASY